MSLHKNACSLFLISLCAMTQGCTEDVGQGCDEATPVSCKDELIQSLSLQDGEPSPQGIENQQDGEFFISTIDARAGGLAADPRQSFIYARFTDQGLEKIEINDIQALDSTEWDIAVHRYIIRLNGGSSGPSCVASVPSDEEIPDEGYVLDDQFDEECAFRGDSEALDAARERDWRMALGVPSPAYYEYVGCVQMTNQRFVLALADASHIEVEVLSFYDEQAQALCDDAGSTNYAGAATLKVRWRPLD